jgi:hypothetical protein
MSAHKKKAPARESTPVGYGKPPIHTRFRKGKSGNPTGKRRHGEAERAAALIRQELYRSLTVRDGDGARKMTALQAVIRSLIACAAKGNVPAQRALVKVAQDIENSRACRTGQSAKTQTSKDPNDISDEVLMGIVRATQDDKP